MKIKKIKINAFGNLKDKEIEFSDGINIIHGENESGKSTLLKCIIDMFYGISKNKRGKVFSDYDRYKPWSSEEFSAKLDYTLDDEHRFEIYRDFNKKNPKIYNENAEDISKDFNIDKTFGNEFFIEQTNVDENMFLSSLVSMQQEVVLDQNNQNVLIQKLANYTNSGDDNISYKKALEKLNKKQREEVGTSRSSGRPINNIKEEKFELQDELGELEEYKNRKYEIEEEKNKIEKEIKNDEIKINYLNEIKNINDAINAQKEKNNLTEKIIDENSKKLEELKTEKNKILEKINLENNKEKNKKIKNNKKINYIFIFIEIILLIIFIINIIKININLISIITVVLGILDFIIYILIKNKNNKNTLYDQNSELKNELNKINLQIELLEKNNENNKIEINKNNEKINFDRNIKIEKLKNDYLNKIDNINNINLNELDYLINKVNNNKLNLHKLKLDTENIIPKLEKMASNEERLEQLNEEEKELIKHNDAIELTKKILEIAYKKMKENVTPEFTNKLSKNIEKISNGKYKKIIINDEEGIIVEKENGEYIEANKLSVGTIDQLYISLRLACINEISKENLPIMLDETFVYCDSERLENILRYLTEEFNNRQIIIFTCSNREVEALNRLDIEYNYIQL